MLHVQLLGPLAVHDEAGNDLTPPGGRERNGLATLAVVSPDSVSTERLANELYRERDTADPRNAVQAMVSRLRRALGRSAGAVETTTSGYRLVDVILDVDEAERLLREAMAATDNRQAAALVEQARSLWHGPTLDGLDGGLIEAERLRIDGLRCDAEDSVLDRRVRSETGTDPDLLGDLEAATRSEPLREKRWELLMLTLYRAGRQADALRAFQRARTLLGDHLGLEPGPALAEVERRILDHDPTLTILDPDRPSATSTSGASGASGADHHPAPDHVTATTTAASATAPAATRLPAGTLSVLLCDVVGSVRRWEVDPNDTASEIERLHQVWSSTVEAERGVVVKSTGDGLLAVFETADRAVRAAAAAMAEQARSGLTVRAAINTGSLEPTDGDYRGPVVNRCARLLDLCNGDQILVSGATAELARPSLGLDDMAVGLRNLGAHWLRDVPEPMPVWQVTGPGLAAVFPPLPSRDPSSLPRLRGRLIGRDQLVERVTELVGTGPLVTLLGPGGIGKTSAALAVAWEAIGWRPVTFVDLARVEDGADVADRLAEAVATGRDGDDRRDPAEWIADRLMTATDLVVIDNAEHVLDAVAVVVDRVVTHQLKGSFLVTSRQPLGLVDEVVVGVPPLEVPDDGDDLAETGRSPSVELFLDRARAGQSGFQLPDGLLPVVAHICRRLDGIPLAIELAAGRSSLLSIDDIAARLDDQLRLLRQVRSHRERRHRSLEAVVRWSVDQLSDAGREVFARISVMTGSFGLDGLEQLLANDGLADIDVLDAVAELNGASLLTVESGGSRFRMLEPIRQFAAAELAQRGLETGTRRAHVRWITDLAADAHAQRDHTRSEALARLDAESDQILGALTWVAEAGQADLAGPLAYPIGWWYLTRDARTGERVIGRLLELVDVERDQRGWAEVVLGLGISTSTHPRSTVAQQSLRAVEIFDEISHPDRGVVRLAAVFAQTGGNDIELPLRLIAEADRLTPSDHRWSRALVDMSVMILRSLVLGVTPEAFDGQETIEIGLRATTTFRDLGDRWALGICLGELGRLHQRLGDLDAAEAAYVESIELISMVDKTDAHGVHYALTELGRMASDRGHHERADRFHAEARRIAEADGNDGCVAVALAGEAYSSEALGHTDRAIELYRQAIGLLRDSIIELGRAEWQAAIDRLENDRNGSAEPLDA